MRTSAKLTPGVADQLPTSPGTPSTHVPSVMQSPLQPGEPWPRLCTCVGIASPAGTDVPGYRRGSGKKDGHSPEGKDVSPTSFHSPVNSAAAKIGATPSFTWPAALALPMSRHSPCAVRQAVEGSSLVPLTMGLAAMSMAGMPGIARSLVQFVYSGSEASAGTACA